MGMLSDATPLDRVAGRLSSCSFQQAWASKAPSAPQPSGEAADEAVHAEAAANAKNVFVNAAYLYITYSIKSA